MSKFAIPEGNCTSENSSSNTYKEVETFALFNESSTCTIIGKYLAAMPKLMG